MQARAPFAPPPMLDTTCTAAAAQDEAETWLRSWLGLAPGAPVGALTTTLQSDLRLQRGTLLLRLGHFDEGKADLEALRVATVGDPLAQYQLALYFRDVGLYRSSIIAASALWRLSPAGALPELPALSAAWPTRCTTATWSNARRRARISTRSSSTRCSGRRASSRDTRPPSPPPTA